MLAVEETASCGLSAKGIECDQRRSDILPLPTTSPHQCHQAPHRQLEYGQALAGQVLGLVTKQRQVAVIGPWWPPRGLEMLPFPRSLLLCC